MVIIISIIILVVLVVLWYLLKYNFFDGKKFDLLILLQNSLLTENAYSKEIQKKLFLDEPNAQKLIKSLKEKELIVVDNPTQSPKKQKLKLNDAGVTYLRTLESRKKISRVALIIYPLVGFLFNIFWSLHQSNATTTVKIAEEKIFVLKLNQFLDTSKPISILYGSVIIQADIDELREGFSPKFVGNIPLFNLQLKNGKLLFTCKNFDIEGNLTSKIENNIFLNPNKLPFYSKFPDSSWVEVDSKKDIPIFQIQLNKENNSLSIQGLFFIDNAYYVIGDMGVIPSIGSKDFMEMNQQERDHIFDKAFKEARTYIIPLRFKNL